MTCYTVHMDDGSRVVFLCGNLGPHCSDHNCGDVSGFQCDFPVSDGKACDLYLCRRHAFEVAPDIHYCPGDALLWREFKESGGVKRELENVVPYKQPPTTDGKPTS